MAVVLVGAVIWYVLASRNSQTGNQAAQTTPTGTSTTTVIGGSLPTGATSFDGSGTASITPAPEKTTINGASVTLGKLLYENEGVKAYDITVSPQPGSGPLDWTQTKDQKLFIIDPKGSKIVKKTACELAGLSNSWSSPLEKFVCDSANFLDEKIIGMLLQVDCDLQAAVLQQNYDPNLKTQYDNLSCKIIDR